ncbi:hypothetical protein [Myceligenerans pegani]|uniref:TrbL/VirB6 plasmid conjugal transfer protein n=1 Tax=Myceligenerans pegani TaxID=2776917 RepID=A0ABR9N1K3_9MICO|nr:hypothetical protein [Myceligenerans sp. TRM 65318]MBE1877530.1 hypothetical protein [Myceligenerans sp. TRM 65318]MBE3019801.1 hypothetical protein [Myceligenerans sp. TRM 65318]
MIGALIDAAVHRSGHLGTGGVGSALRFAEEADDAGSAGISGLHLEDTSGVSTDRFVLQWDTGPAWNPMNVDSEIFSTLAGMFWSWYRDIVAVQIWVLDWVLGMDWLDYVLSPLAGLSLIVQSMIAQIGLLSLTLIILAFVVGFWLLRGRYAGGFMELLIGCVIAALATGFLANPMGTIGGENGVIMQSRDAGMDIATGFATEGASFERDTAAIRDGLKGQLVDTLIRTPHQIINYGSMIDDTRCEGTYTDAVGTDDAVERIGGCDDRYAESAQQIDAPKVVSTLSLLSTGFVFLLLSVVIVGGTLFAVVLLGWSAIKLLWQLPVGVVSSGTRAQLFRTFASIGLGCILVAMATMFLVAWMQMLLGFYDATDGMPFLVRLYLFNTLVVAGAVFYVLMGTSVRAGLRNLADKLATAGVPSQVGEPQAMPWANQAKWTERYNKAKDWAGIGLGPAPSSGSDAAGSGGDSGGSGADGGAPAAPNPAGMDLSAGGAGTAAAGAAAAGAAAGAAADRPDKEAAPADGSSGTDGRDPATTSARAAGEWSDAANTLREQDREQIPAVVGAQEPGSDANAHDKRTDQAPPRTESEKLRDRMANATRTVTRTGLQMGAAAASGGSSAAAVGGARALGFVRRARTVGSAVRSGARAMSNYYQRRADLERRLGGRGARQGGAPPGVVSYPSSRDLRDLGR